jgi:hypothetical protein
MLNLAACNVEANATKEMLEVLDKKHQTVLDQLAQLKVLVLTCTTMQNIWKMG